MSSNTVEKNIDRIEKSDANIKSLRVNISFVNHARFKAVAASVGKPMNVAVQEALDFWIAKQLTGG